MKNLFLLITLGLFSSSVFATSNLEGDYICKKGFLGFITEDTLSIHTAKSGSLYIYMNESDFKITPDCKVNHPEMDIKCEADGKISMVKFEKEYKTTVKTSLSFEKMGSMVIVREEVNSKYGNDLTILVCRTIK